MRVPAADELFRPTIVPEQSAGEPTGTAAAPVADVAVDPTAPAEVPEPEAKPARAASGRVRHDEKVTVYLTADELLDIEHARLNLRRAGVSADRGRLVRTAIALALADLDEHGADSMLVQRLTQQ